MIQQQNNKRNVDRIVESGQHNENGPLSNQLNSKVKDLYEDGNDYSAKQVENYCTNELSKEIIICDQEGDAHFSSYDVSLERDEQNYNEEQNSNISTDHLVLSAKKSSYAQISTLSNELHSKDQLHSLTSSSSSSDESSSNHFETDDSRTKRMYTNRKIERTKSVNSYSKLKVS